MNSRWFETTANVIINYLQYKSILYNALNDQFKAILKKPRIPEGHAVCADDSFLAPVAAVAPRIVGAVAVPRSSPVVVPSAGTSSDGVVVVVSDEDTTTMHVVHTPRVVDVLVHHMVRVVCRVGRPVVATFDSNSLRGVFQLVTLGLQYGVVELANVGRVVDHGLELLDTTRNERDPRSRAPLGSARLKPDTHRDLPLRDLRNYHRQDQNDQNVQRLHHTLLVNCHPHVVLTPIDRAANYYRTSMRGAKTVVLKTSGNKKNNTIIL